jgi:hypothetical protein
MGYRLIFISIGVLVEDLVPLNLGGDQGYDGCNNDYGKEHVEGGVHLCVW